uniref:G_PROTEIN_RECEP_F1_2 domain-containing protein n=1 Tax=Caenorhabditis tropicalis TaxID=1561998 RepID=A0A1I7V2L0_9PELO
MRTSSTNVIMIGIATCDLLCMLIIIRNGYIAQKMMVECTPPRTLYEMRLDWFLTSVHNALRRCSAWLGMLIALVRYIVITDITSQCNKYSTPIYGMRVTMITFLASFVFSLVFFLHVDIVEAGTWQPGGNCESEEIYVVYNQKFNDFFESGNALLARIRIGMEAIFSKLIPCFSLPILTFLLLNEMRKTLKISSSTLEISMANKSVRKSRKERTTVITIFIATSFFLSEFPLGIVDGYKAIWRGNMNYE